MKESTGGEELSKIDLGVYTINQVEKEANSIFDDVIEEKNLSEYYLKETMFKIMYLKEQLLEIMDTLSPREKKVLKMRFGIDNGRPRTLEEVGKEFDVTRERIRQIEAKALRKLRHPSRSKRLKDYLD